MKKLILSNRLTKILNGLLLFCAVQLLFAVWFHNALQYHAHFNSKEATGITLLASMLLLEAVGLFCIFGLFLLFYLGYSFFHKEVFSGRLTAKLTGIVLLTAITVAVLLLVEMGNVVRGRETPPTTFNPDAAQPTTRPSPTEVLPASPPLPAGTYAFDSLTFNLDGDAWPDKLLALKEEENRGSTHYFNPLVTYQLLRGTGTNRFILWGQNEGITRNGVSCAADGYRQMVARPPYFTIEQVACIDFKYAFQFVTFRYNKATDQVLLHKWGEQYTDRSDPDRPVADRIRTSDDFGKVPFGEASWLRVFAKEFGIPEGTEGEGV